MEGRTTSGTGTPGQKLLEDLSTVPSHLPCFPRELVVVPAVRLAGTRKPTVPRVGLRDRCQLSLLFCLDESWAVTIALCVLSLSGLRGVGRGTRRPNCKNGKKLDVKCFGGIRSSGL